MAATIQTKVVILAGPSGVGKATLKQKVLELARSDPALPRYALMPLLYSRRLRTGETNGEFLFVAEEEIARYPDAQVFRRSLYGRYWQAVRFVDLEAAFADDQIRILELPRLLAFDVMDRYACVCTVLLSPVPMPAEWTTAHFEEAAIELECRQRARARARGDTLSEQELRLRIEEGLKLLSVAHRFHHVLVMPAAPTGLQREDVVTAVARQFIVVTSKGAELGQC